MMEQFFFWLAQPAVLWALPIAAITLILLDYLLPVDWLAYIGYACFAMFAGAVVPAGPSLSFVVIVAVLVCLLLLHFSYFTRFLTHKPGQQEASV